MKKTTLIILGLLILYSCNIKQNGGGVTSKEDVKINDYALTTKGVTLKDGILTFSSPQELELVKKSLFDLIYHPNYESNLLKEMGFDLNSKEINKKIPFDPVLQKFEERFKFKSFRNAEELRERKFLNGGGDPKDYKENYIASPVLQTFLNPGGVIGIGEELYWMKDRTTSVIIFDGDREKLQMAMDGKITPNSTENVFFRNSLNPIHRRKWVYRPKRPQPRSNDCEARFTIEYTTTNTWEFTSISLNTNANTVYTWKHNGQVFYTGTGSNGLYAAKQIASSPFNITLEISGTSPTCNSSSTITVGSQCYSVFETIENVSNTNSWSFNVTSAIPQLLGVVMQYDWDFGDGNTQLNAGRTVTHTYAASTSANQYTVKLRTYNTHCSDETSQTITTGCGETDYNNVEFKEYDNGNRRIKMVTDLTNNIFHCFSAKTINQKKSAGSWWPHQADDISVGFIGRSFPEDPNNIADCVVEEHDDELRKNFKNTLYREEVGNGDCIYLRRNELQSIHSVNDNSQSERQLNWYIL